MKLENLLAQLPLGLTARVINAARNHPLVTVAIVSSAIYLAILFAPAMLLGIRQRFSSHTIDKTKAATATEKTAATQEKIGAGQSELERKVEDRFREEKIRPEKDAAASSLAESRRRRQEAEDLYEKNRQSRTPDLDDLSLHRRNCSDLADLFPDQRFAGCQPN